MCRVLRNLIGLTIMLSSLFASSQSAQSAEARSLVEGNTTFALDLYGQLKASPGNLFFSPYSISTALAMTYAGAHGDTEKQMSQVLHFETLQGQAHFSFSELQRQLKEAGAQQGIQLDIANALWAQKGHPFLFAFLNVAKDEYQANINQADFISGAEAARGEINQWVSRQTKDKIQDILPPASVDASTRLVLANAIYFKGKWEHPFSKEATRPGDFHVTADQKSMAPMMHKTAHFAYAEHEDVQILEIPYTKGALRFVAILPRKIDGLSAVEKKLTPAYLAICLGKLRSEKVEVAMPRFEMRAYFQLKQTLGEMGMPVAFAAGEADFSGMDGTQDLFLSAVIHKAFVDVNEEGTEAAAATGVVVEAALARPTAMPRFVADHPFLFLIRDAESGAILFIGRLVKP